jgi:hypothetical protein
VAKVTPHSTLNAGTYTQQANNLSVGGTKNSIPNKLHDKEMQGNKIFNL